MINVQIEVDAASELAPLLERAAEATLPAGGQAQDELSIVISDDEQLQRLNRAYRDLDEATDVLSFAAEARDPESGRRYLGDVVISYERAAEQAEAEGHSLEEELQVLVVHGVLHLLGHKHADEGEKARMWAAQRKILSALGVGARPA